MMRNKETDLYRSHPLKLYINYLIPSLLSLLAVSAYSFVDTFVVGQANGAEAVAAMGVGTPVISILYAIGFLFGSGGAVRYSIHTGLGRSDRARGVYTLSILSIIGIGLLIIICGNVFIRPLTSFLGATSGNQELAIEYLRWPLSFAPMLILDIAMTNFVRNDGHPTVCAIATITGTAANIIFDFLFVMVFRWGMTGAASATCMASCLSVLINGGFSLTGHSQLRFDRKEIRVSEVPHMLSCGLGAAIIEVAIGIITIFFINAAGNWYGDIGVSAYTVVMTVNLVGYSLLNGVAQALQPLVSANYGAGLTERIKKFRNYAILSGFIIGLIFCMVAEFCPVFLTKCFLTDSPEAIELAAAALKYHAIAFVFMGISIQQGIYFQAKEDVMRGTLILLGRSIVFPVLFLMILQIPLQSTAVWVSTPLGEGAAFLMSTVLIRKENG